jgi:hypothetical protein
MQHFDRSPLANLVVNGLVDSAHAPFAELAQHPIFADESADQISNRHPRTINGDW